MSAMNVEDLNEEDFLSDSSSIQEDSEQIPRGSTQDRKSPTNESEPFASIHPSLEPENNLHNSRANELLSVTNPVSFSAISYSHSHRDQMDGARIPSLENDIYTQTNDGDATLRNEITDQNYIVPSTLQEQDVTPLNDGYSKTVDDKFKEGLIMGTVFQDTNIMAHDVMNESTYPNNRQDSTNLLQMVRPCPQSRLSQNDMNLDVSDDRNENQVSSDIETVKEETNSTSNAPLCEMEMTRPEQITCDSDPEQDCAGPLLFLSLPSDSMHSIASFLLPSDLVSLSCTSNHAKKACGSIFKTVRMHGFRCAVEIVSTWVSVFLLSHIHDLFNFFLNLTFDLNFL